MCGIVGYIGTKERPIEELLIDAKCNVHRGDDGVGIIYKTKDKLVTQKLLLSLEEITEKTLNEDKVMCTKRIGSIGIPIKDEKKYDKLQKEHESLMDKVLSIKSNFIFVHHRKGTYGGNTVENLHPFLYNGKYYLHNGTASGFQSVKRWFELNQGIVFKSDTDTEVLAVVYNLLKDKLGNKPKEIFTNLSIMFPGGIGVMVEILHRFKADLMK